MRTDMRALRWLLVTCATASLIHFVHNAVFLDQYPGMPGWISRWVVYATWVAETLIGLAGYRMVGRFRIPGLLTLAAYGVLGFGGLDHYAVAPVSAHSLTMNLTIWLEAATATLLLVGVMSRLAALRSVA